MDILHKDEEHGETISWLPHGRGFMIYKKKLFETKIMPKYFHKNSKYTSFTRKLNRWGFVRVTRGPEMGAYYHKFFKRGESRLCMQMSCQRPNGMGMEPGGFPGGDMAPAMFAQMALQQQQHNSGGAPAGYGANPNAMAGGQNYLQMQQQHMQLLMRHREQMMQRDLMNRQMGGGQQQPQGQQQQMSALQMQQMGKMGMNKQGASTGSPGTSGGQAGMMMMGMQQQGREMGRAGGYPNQM
jgi:hypothetical protein